MAASSSLAIVIVTYHSASVIDGCLDSLAEGLAGLDAEVVVVDNNSADDTVALAEAHPAVTRVIQSGRNAGYAAAINIGTRTVSADRFVMVLNPDVRLDRLAIATLVEVAERSGAGITVPALWSDPSDGPSTMHHSIRREPSITRTLTDAVLGGSRAARLGLGETVADPERYARAGWVDWATGAALLISPPCREALGEWDEQFALYSEETDYCLRARDAGFGVRFEPCVRAVHIGGDLGVSPLLRSQLAANKVKLYRKRHSAAATFVFRLALMVNELLRALAGDRVARAGLVALVRGPIPLPGGTVTAGTAAAAAHRDGEFLR